VIPARNFLAGPVARFRICRTIERHSIGDERD
jgi:hypothetical protein